MPKFTTITAVVVIVVTTVISMVLIGHTNNYDAVLIHVAAVVTPTLAVLLNLLKLEQTVRNGLEKKQDKEISDEFPRNDSC